MAFLERYALFTRFNLKTIVLPFSDFICSIRHDFFIQVFLDDMFPVTKLEADTPVYVASHDGHVPGTIIRFVNSSELKVLYTDGLDQFHCEWKIVSA
jgi:hypothetical protein